jgi:hypothetical protein
LQTSNLILDFEFDQYLESHKHVINIIMGFRDMGCYSIHLLLVHECGEADGDSSAAYSVVKKGSSM